MTDDIDSNTTVVRTHDAQRAEPLRQDMLNLLLEGASAIQSAADEAKLAEVLLDLARRGTGLDNAVMLRALDANGRVDSVMGSTDSRHALRAEMRFSRSLLAAASQGSVAEFSGTAPFEPSQSILQSQNRWRSARR